MVLQGSIRVDRSGRDLVLDDLRQELLFTEELLNTLNPSYAAIDGEHLFRSIFNLSHDAMVLINSDTGCFLDVNRAALELFGLRDEIALTELTPWQLSPMMQSDGILSAVKAGVIIKTVLKTGALVFRWTHRRTDGHEFPAVVMLTAIELSGAKILQATIRDAEEQSEREQALNDVSQRLTEIIDFLPDATFVLNQDSKVIAWNKAMEAMTGVPAATMLGKGDHEYVLPFYGHRRPVLIDLVLHFDPYVANEYLSLTVNGDVLAGECYAPNLPSGPAYLSLKASPLRNAKGEIAGAIESIRDVTEQRRLVELLRTSESRFRDLFDNSPVAYQSLDENGCFTDVNTGLTELLGYPAHELTGRSFGSLWVEKIRPSFAAHFSRLLRNGQSCGEVELERKDKTIVTVQFDSKVQRDAKGNFVRTHCILHNITERKAVEKQIGSLNNMYAALTQTNNVIAVCGNEDTLAAEICRIVVEYGKITMCWIGRIDDDQMIRPLASFGQGTKYLDGVAISCREDIPEGRGPCGVAIRTNTPVIVEDFQNDQLTRPWRDRARQFGWKASATFPILRGGKPYAVLAVHDSEERVIDAQVLDLLGGIAKNVQQALDRLDQTAQHSLFVAALAESETFNRSLIESTHEGVCVWDKEEKLTFVNQRAVEIFGYQLSEASSALGKRVTDFLILEHPPDQPANLHKHLMVKGNQFERRARHKNANDLWLLVSASPLFDRDKNLRGGFAMFTDITNRKADEERIQRLAHFDDLTGLPNRVLLATRAVDALRAARQTGSHCALMFLDLDHFKNINDTLGHHTGDQFLITVANRIAAALSPKDTLSRLGGDEFILLLADTDTGGAVRVAERLLQLIAQPVPIEQHELTTTTSIGIAIYPNHGTDLETLYRCADIAMYEAKKAGRNSYRAFTPEMQSRSQRQVQLTAALRRALENDELALNYQPQVSLDDGSMVGVEALLRWRHPTYGMVSPAEFIPLAEESGLIVSIGEWVLRTATCQVMAWKEAGLPLMPVAVNMSAIQMRQRNLPTLVAEILREAGLPGMYLELELTESVAMGEPEMASAMMESLNELGVRVAIDDFGTGYSSLAYLKRFRTQKLKIDQSFVAGIALNREDEALIRAIINLAHSLRLSTIAEGVETKDQVDFLIKNGCEEVQGYYFSRPLPAPMLLQWALTKTPRAL